MMVFASGVAVGIVLAILAAVASIVLVVRSCRRELARMESNRSLDLGSELDGEAIARARRCRLRVVR